MTSGRRPRRPARRGRRAFTIAEVMVAATVMALAISTAITTMQSAFLALASARSITFASQIMQSEMEKIRLRNWEGIVDLGENADVPINIPEAFRRHPAIGNRYSLSRTIRAVPGNPNLKEITFRISWRGINTQEHVRYYTTYYGKNGLYDYLSS